MKEHKHAEVLRQIADGVPLSEFEVRGAGTHASWMTLAYADFHVRPDFWEVRRKPQHIIVNGFKVPKPLDAVPIGRVYTPAFMGEGDGGWFNIWCESLNRDRAIQRGIAHTTKEAATAHAKAMLGIDPKWEPYFP